MTNSPKPATRKRLLTSAAMLALAGVIGFGAVGVAPAPVLAQAVAIEPAVQMPSFADVVQKVSPAVVSVQVKGNIQNTADRGPRFGSQDFDNLPDDHPLKRFFREFRGDDGPGPDFRRDRRGARPDRPNRSPRAMAQGSGFFISDDGYVVTNNHVVKDGSAFTVVGNDGKEYDAKLVGTDSRTDLAVLKVDAKDQKFTYVDFADDSAVRVGDWVVAVGNPFGLGGTVTAGIVSARGRDIGAGPYDDFIQIDAAVNHGNSGGPAFNLNGKVVGINTAIFAPGGGGNVGIAFAIPASTAKQVVENLKAGKPVARGWLGVQIQPVNADVAESLGLKEARGALVAEPQADTPAAKAGIKSGDVIVAVNGAPVAGPRELARTIAGFPPGTAVDVTLWRSNASQDVKVTLGELPDEQKVASAAPAQGDDEAAPSSTLDDLGLTVTANDSGSGLVVTDVDPDSDAAERGIQAGDVITKVNSTDVRSAGDVQAAIKTAADAGRKSVLFQIQREDNTRFVPLPVDQG